VNSRKYDLMNTPQLLYSIDSVGTEVLVFNERNVYNFSDMLGIENQIAARSKLSEASKDGIDKKLIDEQAKITAYNKKTAKKVVKRRKYESIIIDSMDIASASSFIEIIKPEEHETIIKSAHNKANHMNRQVQDTKSKIQSAFASKNRFLYKLHQQYSWALICFMFLFIGAPLGSIIKKGGYGVPLLVSILFFMLFIVIGIMADRLQATQVLNPYLAAWLPNLILFPFAVVFTYKAVRDSRFNFDRWKIKSFMRRN